MYSTEVNGEKPCYNIEASGTIFVQINSFYFNFPNILKKIDIKFANKENI